MLWWIDGLYHWLRETQYFWITLFVLSVSLYIIFLPEPNEARVRITGLTLQVFGMSTVLIGINRTRQFFGHPSFLKIVIQCLKRFPLRRQVITGRANIELPMMTAKAFAHQWTNAVDDSPEARLRALETNLDIVNQRVTQVHNQLDHDIRHLEHTLHSERTTRENTDQEIRRTIELTETGGLSISLMGLLWLVVGIIMSTIPSEMASLLKMIRN